MRRLLLLGVPLVLLAGCSGRHQVTPCTAALALPSVRIDLRPLLQIHPDAHGRFCTYTSGDRAGSMCSTFGHSATGSVTPTPGYGDPPGSIRVHMTPGDDHLSSRVWLGGSLVTSVIRLHFHADNGPCGGLIYSPLVLQRDGSLAAGYTPGLIGWGN